MAISRQTLPATDSAKDLRNLVGNDPTATFEDDPTFVDSNPTENASSENLNAAATPDAEEVDDEDELDDADTDEADEDDLEDEDEDEDEDDDEDDYDDEDDEDEDDVEDADDEDETATTPALRV